MKRKGILIISLLPLLTFLTLPSASAAKFSLGSIVEDINTLNIGLAFRDAPAGNNLSRKYDGSRGMVFAGPQSAYLNSKL